MFKALIKLLHPLLTATQEGNYYSTEGLGAIPFTGILLAHSNESEWHTFRNNKNNEAFIDRIYIVKDVPGAVPAWRLVTGRHDCLHYPGRPVAQADSSVV